jgi:prepilin-type N-terminal cleavage/methylation domain-containing protein
MTRVGRDRAGFSLVEIMISMFVLSMGLILLAASFPAALRSVAESQDITVSTFGSRIAATWMAALAGTNMMPIAVAGADSCGTSDEAVHWYGPAADSAGNSGSPRWFVNNPAPPNQVTGNPNVGWGMAIPYSADERYAIQIFYRRVPMGTPAVPAPSGWPHTYHISIVVVQQRDGTFAPPVSTRGDDSQLTAVCSVLQTGDICCTWNGRWFRYSGPNQIAPGTFGWGVPGGIGVFHSIVELPKP